MPLVTGEWQLRQIYRYAYFPIAGSVWLLGALGQLPRVKASTAGEGHERRYFYGSVWAVAIAQPMLWFLWKVLPRGFGYDALKLIAFVGVLAGRRLVRAAWSAAAHPADRAGRTGDFRLTEVT